MQSKRILAVALMAGLALAGCSSNTERKTTVCTGSSPADETTFVSEGDKVITQTEYDIYTWDEIGLTADDVDNQETMGQLLEYYKSLYDISKGFEVTYAVNKDDQTVTFTLVLDYTAADMEELEKRDIVDDTDSDYVSLEATIQNFESEGLTCK